MAFDPAAFGSDAVARFGVLAQSIEAQQGARLPGMRRLAAREKAKAEGLTITDALMKEIEAILAHLSAVIGSTRSERSQ